jgi:hypothetical protein
MACADKPKADVRLYLFKIDLFGKIAGENQTDPPYRRRLGLRSTRA